MIATSSLVPAPLPHRLVPDKEISKSRQVLLTYHFPVDTSKFGSSTFDELSNEDKEQFNEDATNHFLAFKDIWLAYGLSAFKYSACCIEQGEGGRTHMHLMLWAHKDAKSKAAWMSAVPHIRSENMDCRCCKGTANDTRIYLKKGSCITKEEYYGEWTDGKKAAHRHPSYGSGLIRFWEAGTPPDADAHKKGIEYVINILNEFGKEMLDKDDEVTEEYFELVDGLKEEIVAYVDIMEN